MSNGVILQTFQWYTPADGTFWKSLGNRAQELKNTGFTALWLPPAYKGAAGPNDVGYRPYDLYDLGEFNQKGAVNTKYGTREEFLALVDLLRKLHFQVLLDVVLNHKDGGDLTELVTGQIVDWNNRNNVISGDITFNAYTKFTFPGRNGTYSAFTWNSCCFDGLTYNADNGRSDQIYRLKCKEFSTEVSHEHSNYDYLMANDIDYDSRSVRDELLKWGNWLCKTTSKTDGNNIYSCIGFRLDALKHIDWDWYPEWLGNLRGNYQSNEFFSVGEYWSGDVRELHDFIRHSEGCCSLFDVPLHYNFRDAGNGGYDMRKLWDKTLMKEQPSKAVTFVDNHDSQPCQSLESPVAAWFKPLAYAFILLRAQGYPCVFIADYDGATYSDQNKPPVTLYSHRYLIDIFIDARKKYNYGDQHDYLDHPNTIGWTRTGDANHPGSMAVLMTNGSEGNKYMQTYRPNTTYKDATKHMSYQITTDSQGGAMFTCLGGKVSVWVPVE